MPSLSKTSRLDYEGKKERKQQQQKFFNHGDGIATIDLEDHRFGGPPGAIQRLFLQPSRGRSCAVFTSKRPWLSKYATVSATHKCPLTTFSRSGGCKRHSDDEQQQRGSNDYYAFTKNNVLVQASSTIPQLLGSVGILCTTSFATLSGYVWKDPIPQ